MKSVTYDQVLNWNPCWLGTEEGKNKLEEIGKRRERWTVWDVLELPESEVSKEDKMWAVLREELIDAPVLHEFACRCAEEALKLVDNPDPRSVAAIDAKRRWLRGEIPDWELEDARAAAWDACDAAWDAARAAWAAARAAACDAAWAAANAAASAASAARAAAWAAARAAAWAACDAAMDAQIAILKELLTICRSDHS